MGKFTILCEYNFDHRYNTRFKDDFPQILLASGVENLNRENIFQ